MAEGRLFVNTKDESPRLCLIVTFLISSHANSFWVPIIICVPAVVFFSWLSFEAGIQWYIYIGSMISWCCFMDASRVFDSPLSFSLSSQRKLFETYSLYFSQVSRLSAGQLTSGYATYCKVFLGCGILLSICLWL